MAVAYEGAKPYIFISYSHRDADVVMAAIEALQREGYAVWYDGGIEVGSEWPEYIAAHLRSCFCVLSFLSPNFVQSDNCRRELNFAQDIKKTMLNIYITDVDLPDGLRMQLGLNQALYRTRFSSDDKFFASLCAARLLQPCRLEQTPAESVKAEPKTQSTAPAMKSEKPAEPKTEKTKRPVAELKNKAIEEKMKNQGVQESRKKETHPKLKKWVGIISSLIELSYIFVGPYATDMITSSGVSWWQMVLLMILPFTMLSILVMFLHKTVGRKLTDSEKDDALVAPFACLFLAAVVAVVIGMFKVRCVSNFILKFLISLGLNIIPTLGAFVFIVVLGISYDKKK